MKCRFVHILVTKITHCSYRSSVDILFFDVMTPTAYLGRLRTPHFIILSGVVYITGCRNRNTWKPSLQHRYDLLALESSRNLSADAQFIIHL